MVDLLLLHNQNRGLDAAGVALQQANGDVVVHKDNRTAFEFVTGKEYKDFMDANLRDDTVIVLGHTRKATKGTPRVIANNHPMFVGNVAVVHNGHISNDDDKFKEWKLERKAETDSDIIRAVLDREGFTRKAIDLMSRLCGNAAFAAISPKHPGELLLARSGNPVEICQTKDFFMFSSEKGPLYKALRPYEPVRGILMRKMTPIDYYMIGMTDNSAWLLGAHPDENWLEWTQEMKIAYNYSAPAYTCHVQFHGNRIRFYDDKPVDVVQCPNPLCNVYLSVNQAMLDKLKTYKCATCKTPLA